MTGPGSRVDLSVIGQRFERFVVVSFSHSNGSHSFWNCRCDCGAEFVARDIKRRISCGCAMLEHQHTKFLKHGLSHLPEHYIWVQIVDRCEDQTNDAYDRYGGRGIRICDEWRSDFLAFYRDMGPRPSPKHSVDRIDNDGNYEPGNCRWATAHEQNRNQRTNVWLTLDGRRQIAADWASELGLSRPTITRRRQRGWTDEEILLTPKGARLPMVPEHRRAA